MTILNKTAYPRFKKIITTQELKTIYTPTLEENVFVTRNAKGEKNRLHLMLFFKSFQRLGYFVQLSKLPTIIVNYIAKTMSISSKTSLTCAHATKIRFYNLIKQYKQVKTYGSLAQKLISNIISERAKIIDNPSDLINIAIEELINNKFELPAFSTLERLISHTRNKVNNDLYKQISSALSGEQTLQLKNLLIKKEDEHTTKFNFLKQPPRNPSLSNFKNLLEHLAWLMSFGNIESIFADIAISKIECFASEANVLDAAEMKDVLGDKQIALIACLICTSRMKNRDYLTETFIRRLSSIHKKGKDELDSIREQYRERSESLLDTFGVILKTISSKEKNVVQKWKSLKSTIEAKGGAESLIHEYEKISSYNGNNYYILLWRHYKSHRTALFSLIECLNIKSTTHNDAIIKAMNLLIANKDKKAEYLLIDSNSFLSFAPDKWKTIILQKKGDQWYANRRHFEVCIFSCLAEALNSVDIYVEDSLAFADYRAQLLPIEECDQLLDDYCKAIKIPSNSRDFINYVRGNLSDTANTVDKQYPRNTHLQIDKNGIPMLKKTAPQNVSPSVQKLEKTILSRMPERNILDILVNAAYWTDFTKNFGPMSGTSPKISNKIEKYVLTLFAYGCSLGPTQTARHLRNEISAHILQFINKKHITAQKLDKALQDSINILHLFDLPKIWGDSNKAIADGTFVDIYERNLIAESHVRYGGYGGIAYHHISDTYIALFSHFIPCGVWEAIYIIEGLLKNKSDIHINTIHADTQGQSAIVFAVAFLLGIKLEPRIRNWKDLIFYKPSKNSQYNHIDSLFGGVPDWERIETHWKDMMQVVLSIKAGKISSAVLLKRLGNYSKKNKLYQAFREFGKVIRTIFLLEYISDVKKRKQISASTNKIEAYNAFSQWFSFGSLGVITSNYFDEQEKAVKYNDLVANSVMLQNIIDMSEIIQDLKTSKMPVRKQDLATLSPYITEHIKRFGNYVIDVSKKPPDLNKFIKL